MGGIVQRVEAAMIPPGPSSAEVPRRARLLRMGDVLPSSLRLLRAGRQFYRQGTEYPLANPGGPRDKPGAGRPRPPRGRARVAARLATP